MSDEKSIEEDREDEHHRGERNEEDGVKASGSNVKGGVGSISNSAGFFLRLQR